jgi:hypothetical protein
MKELKMSIFDFIVELRGGIPENCDFCGKPFTEENYATPEEAVHGIKEKNS